MYRARPDRRVVGREGIYSSYLADWRRERENGQLQGLTGQQRGRPRNEQATEMARLQQENERLKAQLAQAELIITAQKTVASFRANLDAEQGVALVMAAIEELAPSIGVSQACAVFDFPHSSLYRRRRPRAERPHARPTPPSALSVDERAMVCAVFNSERFADQTPYEVYAILLDEEVYLCSIRTMYRILHEAAAVQERRNQLRHPAYIKPELLATAPNQLWSWDITKLRGPATWQYFYLYVMLDVFSRYVVGWILADHESAELAKQLLAESCEKQGIPRDQLVLHADRDAAMTAKSLAQLLADLGIEQSHSRLYTPDDGNPLGAFLGGTVQDHEVSSRLSGEPFGPL